MAAGCISVSATFSAELMPNSTWKLFESPEWRTMRLVTLGCIILFWWFKLNDGSSSPLWWERYFSVFLKTYLKLFFQVKMRPKTSEECLIIRTFSHAPWNSQQLSFCPCQKYAWTLIQGWSWKVQLSMSAMSAMSAINVLRRTAFNHFFLFASPLLRKSPDNEDALGEGGGVGDDK